MVQWLLCRAKKATAVAYERISADLVDPLVLTFNKIGTFTRGRNQINVVFAQLSDDLNKQRLIKLAGMLTVLLEYIIVMRSLSLFHLETVKSTFEEYQLFSTDKRPLKPHLTIAKLSRDFPSIRSINPYLYQKYNELMFGTEQVQGIELLAMSNLADPEDGYYKVLAKHP